MCDPYGGWREARRQRNKSSTCLSLSVSHCGIYDAPTRTVETGRERQTDREREKNRRRGGRERQKSPETREGEEERDAARTRHESLGGLVAGRSAELTDSLISFPADNETNSSRFEPRLAGEQTLP